jgi:O-acetyl-ADP-ribose deacetylase (regulator of RNase III)
MRSERSERTIGRTRITTVQGDITRQETDAIVNAANPSLMGGGGVDGAIHRTGGPQILEECKRIIAEIGRCQTGEAVITGGGNLEARHVIHTVGPVWHGGTRGEPELLESAYKSSLAVASARGVRSISFPSISTGAYGYPVEKAAKIALDTVAEFVKKSPFEEVRFVLFSEEDFRTYTEILSQLP